jgi:sortase A
MRLPSPFRRLASRISTRLRPGSGQRLSRAVSLLLIVIGVLLAVEVVLTVFWREPVTAVVASKSEEELRPPVETHNTPQPMTEPEVTPVALRESLAPQLKRAERRTSIGEALGRIEVKRLGVKSPFVQGADLSSLEAAPGHYVNTQLPGDGGTVGIAGHRTTYGAPFRNLHEMRKGDEVVLKMPYGRFTYEIQGTKVVQPEAVEVLERGRREQLVLTACHPPGSLAQRIVALADLVEADGRPVIRQPGRSRETQDGSPPTQPPFRRLVPVQDFIPTLSRP